MLLLGELNRLHVIANEVKQSPRNCFIRQEAWRIRNNSVEFFVAMLLAMTLEIPMCKL